MTGYIERILVLLLYSFIDQPTSLWHRQNIISYNKDNNLKQNISLLDPCSNTFEHDILTDDGFRSPACRRSQSEPRCDDNIVEGWYVLHSSDGSTTLRVHRECPRQSRCGTDNPIWWMVGNRQNVIVTWYWIVDSVWLCGHLYCTTYFMFYTQ